MEWKDKVLGKKVGNIKWLKTKKKEPVLLTTLYAALDSAIERNDENAPISIDKKFLYREQIGSLERHLQEHPIRRLDTAEIDKKLASIEERVRKAVEEDMPETAEEGVKALTRGILLCRADITERETADSEKIVEDRMRLLAIMETGVAATENVERVRKYYERAKIIAEKCQADLAALDEELKIPVKEESDEATQRQSRREALEKAVEQAVDHAADMKINIREAEAYRKLSELHYLFWSSSLQVEELKRKAERTAGIFF